jgi:glutamate racemase
MQRPIGIFDSGLGGLTVVRAVRRRLPAEAIVYFGDTARVPYGIKSADTVTRFTEENIKFLQGFDPKLIIAACNTASATALPRLDGKYSIPLCGVVEPGARAAVRKTRTRRIGVIGTEATISSKSYLRCIAGLATDVKVFSKACPLLVPLVEEGRSSLDEVVLMVLREYLEPLKSREVDTFVLGCTHYPLLKQGIRRVMGLGVHIVDSARETAREAAAILGIATGGSTAPAEMRHQFYASDNPRRFAHLGRRFLGRMPMAVKLVQPELINGKLELRRQE